MADQGGRRRSGSFEHPPRSSLDRPEIGRAEENVSSMHDSQPSLRGDPAGFSILPAIIETKTPPMSRAASFEDSRIAPMIQETAPTPNTKVRSNPIEARPSSQDFRPPRDRRPSLSPSGPRITPLHRVGTTPSQPPRSARSPGFPPATRPRGRTESSRQPSIRSLPLSPRSLILGRQASSVNTAGIDGHEFYLERQETGTVRTGRPRAASSNQSSIVSPGLRHRVGTWATATRPRSGTIRRRPTVLLASGRDGGDGQETGGDFTLAGPSAVEVMEQNQPYVDPGYTDLNPAYEQLNNARPVWGLAKPLPRVIRAGMIPTRSELNVNTDGGNEKTSDPGDNSPDMEQGRIEPTLRLDRISTQLQQARQRREENLMKTFSRTNSWAASIASPTTPSGRINPSIDVAIEEEHDPGISKFRLSDLHDEDINGEHGAPPVYPDNASAATTEHDHDDFPEENWIDNFDLKPNDGNAKDEIHNLHTHWSVLRLRFREPLAELLAVTVQLTLGFCANLAYTTSGGTAGTGDTTSWAWGLASMTGIYIAGGISGAHLNPAVSIMLWIFRGFPMRKIPIYVLAQLLGAFLAALIAFALFKNNIAEFGGANLANSGTLGDFITYPRHKWIDAPTAFFTEFTATSILAIAILAMGDDTNAPPGAGMSAFVMGLVITVLSLGFGYNTGCAMNPIRDLGPRLAVLALGYGRGTAFPNSYWIWGPWVATITGAVFGAFLYDAAIFVGGESPVNYPRKRIKRANKKWRRKWAGRFRSANRTILGRGEKP